MFLSAPKPLLPHSVRSHVSDEIHTAACSPSRSISRFCLFLLYPRAQALWLVSVTVLSASLSALPMDAVFWDLPRPQVLQPEDTASSF